jgi:hypothetical protein
MARYCPMTYAETVRWLDDHGGTWVVRATPLGVAILASVSSFRAVRAAADLTHPRLEEALIGAVDELRRAATHPTMR